MEHVLGTVVLSCFSEEGRELWNTFWGLWSCLASLKRGENCGTCCRDCGLVWHGHAVLPYVPVLVMYPDCGHVWNGQCSRCTSPSHVPRLVMAGMASVPFVLALVMYPDWFCLEWAVFHLY